MHFKQSKPFKSLTSKEVFVPPAQPSRSWALIKLGARRACISMAAALTMMTLTGCSPSTRHSAGEKPIVVGLSLEPLGFFPLRSLDSGSYYAQTLVFEGLLRYDANTRIAPGLCSSFDVSKDGLTYTLQLRQGVRFSDGQPISLDDVVASIDLARSDFSPYKGDYDAIAAVERRGASTVVLHLSRPSTPLLSRLVELRLLPKRIIATADHGQRVLSRHPVGAGPFILERWQSGLELVFRRNPYYWGEPAGCERLVWRVLPDKTLTALALKRGEIDVAQLDAVTWRAATMSDGSANRQGKIAPVQEEAFPGTRTVYLGFNTLKAPFDNERVRQAVCLSINRAQLLKGLYGGFGIVPRADVPRGSWAYNSDAKLWPYDLSLARQYLSDSGYRFENGCWQPAGDQGGRQKLAFRILTLRDYQDVAAVVAEDLKQLGLICEVQVMEYATLRQRYLSKGLFETVVWSRSSGPDPECALVWGSGGALNYSQFNLPEMDRLIALGKREVGQAARKRVYSKIQSILADEVPWVFLVQPELLIAHRSDIANIKQANQSLTGLPWDNPLFNAARWRRVKVNDDTTG